jgi:hypothetical protein
MAAAHARTSQTDPLRIDAVPAGPAGGLIGLTFCPGKRGASVQGPAWQRSLAADLDVVQAWAPATVVTLIEDHEFTMLGVPDLGTAVQARGLQWLHLPIPDLHAPDARFEAAWPVAGARLRQQLLAGQRVLVHCRGGLGRAGTVAARLLVELGTPPDAALQQVRRARPGAIETAAQVAHVRALRPGPHGLV